MVAVRDNDVNSASATKMTSGNELTADSPLVAVPAETASTSVWTTLDVAEQQARQLVQPAGQGRQSLASVGNESSFFRKDAVSDEHLCSTPSQNDNIDEQVMLQQQASSPCSDWTCAPAALHFSPGSPSMTRDVPGQRSPPVTSLLTAGRRHGCVQMPRLTPIIEADIELSHNDDDDDDDDDDHDDDDDDSEVFVAAAKCVEVEFNSDDRQTEADAVRSSSRHSERLKATSDVLDLTIVTPITSLELTPLSTCAGSSSSELAPCNNESRDQEPEMDVDDKIGGTEIINRSRRDVDDLTTEETGQNQHESSYSGVYSNYMCADNVNAASPAARRWEEWDLVDGSARAQDAVSALSLPARRLTYQKSYLNRTPIDIGMMQLPADRVYRHRRRRHHHQQQQQLSVPGCSLDRQTDALAGRHAVGDDRAVTRANRSIRHRLSLYHENLI